MFIQTKYLGEIEVTETKIIHFPAGIPGFFAEKKFVLLDLPGNKGFQMLQSVQTEKLALIVTNPHYFYQKYEFKLDEPTRKQLNINQVEDVVILSIVTLKDSLTESTLNLKAPIIINCKLKLGKQLILNDANYSLRAPLTPKKEGL